MAEQFLTLMADLDDDSQKIMSEWYHTLKEAGFTGTQTPGLTALHEACAKETIQTYPWTPHATLLIDEPETVCDALRVLVKSFYPFVGKINRLHLCAFWPTREIAAVEIVGQR